MARSRTDKTHASASLRLRVPASLAVALFGASATVTMSFGGCQDETPPEPRDAGVIEKRRDAGPDGASGTGSDGSGDGGDGSDAGGGSDAGDATVDAGTVLVDADDPPPSDAPDLRPPVDAYVPPPDGPDH